MKTKAQDKVEKMTVKGRETIAFIRRGKGRK